MAGIVHEVENHRLVEQAEQEAAEAARELAEIAHLRRGPVSYTHLTLPTNSRV